MYAHLYKSRVKTWILIINDSQKPIGGVEFVVSNKKEAKQIAKSYNATAWNF